MQVVRPGLEQADVTRVAHDVACRWRPREVAKLLALEDLDIRRVAAAVLGLVGDMTVVPALARALRDRDAQINSMAEHSLWAIWFRSGSNEAAPLFKRGVAMIGSENYRQALPLFKQALRIDPQYAEAWNQCAIAHFFLDEYSLSLSCCKKVIQFIPVHFGAISGMGHSYMQLGDRNKALQCYQWALRINPHMTAIAGAVKTLQQQRGDDNDSSGIYSSNTAIV